jgi:uncharacterized Zn finger protein
MAWGWPKYVSAAERRRKAARAVERFAKKGVSPVVLEGRTIARTFWGKSWCTNLERYSDFSNRLPRGRTYVRSGSVVDLQLARGMVNARVSGTRLYTVRVEIAPVLGPRWTALCGSCAGGIDSLVELLQGHLSKAVMERICAQKTGLFPSPAEIRFTCSCPDWAAMCKHVAAVLYGVGARLDERPELLFELRGVDAADLIARAGRDLSLARARPKAGRVLAEEGLSEMFGIDLGEAKAAPAGKVRRARADAPKPRGAAAAKRPKPRDAAAKGRTVGGPPQGRRRG